MLQHGCVVVAFVCVIIPSLFRHCCVNSRYSLKQCGVPTPKKGPVGRHVSLCAPERPAPISPPQTKPSTQRRHPHHAKDTHTHNLTQSSRRNASAMSQTRPSAATVGSTRLLETPASTPVCFEHRTQKCQWITHLMN